MTSEWAASAAGICHIREIRLKSRKLQKTHKPYCQGKSSRDIRREGGIQRLPRKYNVKPGKNNLKFLSSPFFPTGRSFLRCVDQMDTGRGVGVGWTGHRLAGGGRLHGRRAGLQRRGEGRVHGQRLGLIVRGHGGVKWVVAVRLRGRHGTLAGGLGLRVLLLRVAGDVHALLLRLYHLVRLLVIKEIDDNRGLLVRLCLRHLVLVQTVLGTHMVRVGGEVNRNHDLIA